MSRARPNYKRPTLWYGLGYNRYNRCYRHYDRIRIIYPNGKTEFIYCYGCFGNHGVDDFVTPCWSKGVVKKPKDLVAAMRKYDKENRIKTLFIGNL